MLLHFHFFSSTFIRAMTVAVQTNACSKPTKIRGTLTQAEGTVGEAISKCVAREQELPAISISFSDTTVG